MLERMRRGVLVWRIVCNHLEQEIESRALSRWVVCVKTLFASFFLFALTLLLLVLRLFGCLLRGVVLEEPDVFLEGSENNWGVDTAVFGLVLLSWTSKVVKL